MFSEEKIKEIIKNNLIDCSKNEFTDKAFWHAYEFMYPDLLSKYFGKTNNILEIGIYKGGGLKFLHDTFENSKIFGSDNDYSKIELDLQKYTRLKLLPESDQTEINTELLPWLDIVIEDASHDLNKSISTFNLLKPKLNLGGIYVIEDIYPQYINQYKSLNHFKLIDITHIKNRGDDVCAIYIKS